jgi:hypothetical protein
MNLIAYQIGGVFLLAGLFIFGTMVKGIVPEAFRAGKPLGILVLLGALGLGIYHYRLDLEAGWSSLFESAPAPASAAAAAAPNVPGKPAPRMRPAAAAAPAPVPQPKIIIVEEAPAAETTTALVPAPAPEVASSDAPADAPKGNRLKRGVKSVGHFLHLGHQQPE